MERLTFEGSFCDIAKCRNTPGGSFCEDGACSQRLVWERVNGPGSCRWASEIEPFCIKVTKYRFGEG